MNEWVGLDQIFALVVVIFTVANLAAGLHLVSLAPTVPFFPLATAGEQPGNHR